MNKDPFIEYIKSNEPDKYNKSYAWSTAIGLQAVDGLETSKYLIDIAIKNIEGKITIDEADALINSYYESNPDNSIGNRTEEADKVSLRIAKILSEPSFTFSPYEYISIHKKLFIGIYSHAGIIRDYNITKKEWILNGDTVSYGTASNLMETLEYDFKEEKKFNYKNLTAKEKINHFARFIANLWQTHIFGEGNTRTTAVFFIKYLISLGYNVTNDAFAKNAWYFRNALVRANYNNFEKCIYETTEYLELFLSNLLLNEHNELHNRYMHIDYQNTKNESVNESVNLNRNEILVLNEIINNNKIKRMELIEKINLSRSTIDRVLASLKTKNIIERVGSDKTGYWKVNKTF